MIFYCHVDFLEFSRFFTIFFVFGQAKFSANKHSRKKKNLRKLIENNFFGLFSTFLLKIDFPHRKTRKFVENEKKFFTKPALKNIFTSELCVFKKREVEKSREKKKLNFQLKLSKNQQR